MSLTVRDVYEWHMDNAKECLGRSDLKNEAEMHLDFAKALQPHLPPQPCGMCHGSGLIFVHDSDAHDVVTCDCQYVA